MTDLRKSAYEAMTKGGTREGAVAGWRKRKAGGLQWKGNPVDGHTASTIAHALNGKVQGTGEIFANVINRGKHHEASIRGKFISPGGRSMMSDDHADFPQEPAKTKHKTHEEAMAAAERMHQDYTDKINEWAKKH